MKANQLNFDLSGNKNYFEYILVFLFIVLLPFENSALQASSLGLYGASLSLLPVLVLFLYRLFCNKIEKEFFLFFMYSTIVFILSFFLFKWMGYDDSIILYQPIKNYILYLTWFYVFFFFKNQENFISYIRPINILFYITLFIIFLSVYFFDFINSISFLSYSDIRNSKPRGFSLESSTFGFFVSVVFLLYMWVNKKNLALILFLLFFCLIFIQSKGSLSSIFIALIISSLLLMKRNFLINIVYILIAMTIYFLTVDLILSWFLVDIETYTSFATRIVLILLGLYSVFFSPLGWGFSGYYPHFYLNIDKIIHVVNDVSPMNLNFSEVIDYSVVGNFQSVGTKSFFMDCLIVYGLPFLFFMLFYLRNIYRCIVINNDYNRMLLLIFLLIALTFYNSSFGMYIGAFALGLIFNRKIRN